MMPAAAAAAAVSDADNFLEDACHHQIRCTQWTTCHIVNNIVVGTCPCQIRRVGLQDI